MTGAERSARQHPYVVETFTAWGDHRPVVVGFQSEDEARAFAVSRPEPLIDLIDMSRNRVIAVRRMAEPYRPFRDDFPQTEAFTEE